MRLEGTFYAGSVYFDAPVLVLHRSSNDGLCWVAWANLFARAHSITDTGKLSLAHGTHQITCDEALPLANGHLVYLDRLDGGRGLTRSAVPHLHLADFFQRLERFVVGDLAERGVLVVKEG